MPNFTPICRHSKSAYATEANTERTALHIVGCRRWTCKLCGPTRRRELVARIVASKPTKFITLTCRHEGGPEVQLKKIVKGLQRVAKWIRKDIGPIEYLRMVEACRDGYPHFHLLARADYVDKQKLSDKWEEFTGAIIVDIKKAHGRSTGYISKYITKARDQDKTWSRQRMSVTRGFWIKSERPQDDSWENWRHNKCSAYEEAQLIGSDRALERKRTDLYDIVEREPGDDVPLEIAAQFDNA